MMAHGATETIAKRIRSELGGEKAARSDSDELKRNQPCGCVVCVCASETRCYGCGAGVCGEDHCVFNDVLGAMKPVYETRSDSQQGEGGGDG